MKRFWHWVTHLGVTDSLSAFERKCVITINTLAFIVIPMGSTGFVNRFLPVPIIADLPTAVMVSGCFFVLLFNHLRFYTTARLWFNLVGLGTMIWQAYLFGAGNNNHLMILLVVITAFFTYPDHQSPIRWTIVAISYLGFSYAEIMFTEPALDLAPAVSAQIRIGISVSVISGCIGFAYYILLILRRSDKALTEAHDKAESLLLNILPESIAERLKAGPGSIADRFESATVLFTDIVGFTKLSTNMSATELVAMLDEIFSEFDSAAEELGLEKIKTIGDAYMIAGGIPDSKPGHCQAVARMALAMQKVMKTKYADKYGISLRIGIHKGPVVAGVIGRKKFTYDLWGDTVNTSSRMESHGVPGEIQVTEAVYTELRDKFQFTPREPIEVKGKGLMRTYLLTGPKAA